MKFRTFLLGLSALFIAIAAAYFSITGLSKLFAGASMAVILMASSLEFGKLISASFLYAYWDKINKLLRAYLVIGVSVLVLITSAGIYGFLTSAYQVTADQLEILDKGVSIIQLKKERFESQLVIANNEREILSQSINELSKGLANNVVEYTDKSGNVMKTTSSANRTALERQLASSQTQRDILTSKVDVLTDSVTNFDIQILNLQSDNEVSGEIGTLKYLSEITGQPMSNIINWFALMIVFVFDPLAVTLVIAFNTAMKIDNREKNSGKLYKLYGEGDVVMNTLSNEEAIVSTVDETKKIDTEVDVNITTPIKKPRIRRKPIAKAKVRTRAKPKKPTPPIIETEVIQIDNQLTETEPEVVAPTEIQSMELVDGDYKLDDLTEDDIKKILEVSENPPEPNDALKRAAKRYKELMSNSSITGSKNDVDIGNVEKDVGKSISYKSKPQQKPWGEVYTQDVPNYPDNFDSKTY